MRCVAFALPLLAGCTAAKAQFQILAAEQGLHQASDYGSSRIATFEFSMAELYLSKAKEKAGYSEFRVADALARQSAEWSDRAIIYVQRHGANLDLSIDEAAGPPASNPRLVEPEPTAPPIDDLDDDIEIP